MDRPPIFLYTSWRTGGTALAGALKADEKIMLFYDPLNEGLMNYEYAKTVSSDTWNSNHPPGFKYFDEYLPMFVDGKLRDYPDLKGFKFRNSTKEFQDQLLSYLDRLVTVANENDKTPVFKFEQLEGHLEVIKRHFPTAIHLGLLRNRQAQFDSWLEQLALGSSGFFDGARKLVLEDPDYFTSGVILENPTDREVFELYHSKLIQLCSKFDLVFNLYEDDREEFLSKIAPNSFQQIFSVAFERLDKLGKPPTFEKKFIRMTERSLELTQQRDELTQQRDELTQQRDELTQQRDELTQQRDELTQQRDELNQQRDELTQQRDELTQQRDELTQQRDDLMDSTIWKVTKPLRNIVNFFKR
jgi:hypothetical protein